MRRTQSKSGRYQSFHNRFATIFRFGKQVTSNDFVIANIDYAMANDGAGMLAVKAFKEMNAKKVWDPDRIIIPFDHYTPAQFHCFYRSPKAAEPLPRIIKSNSSII